MNKYLLIIHFWIVLFVIIKAINGWYTLSTKDIELDEKYFYYEQSLEDRKFILECQQLSAQSKESWNYESCLKALEVHPDQQVEEEMSLL